MTLPLDHASLIDNVPSPDDAASLDPVRSVDRVPRDRCRPQVAALPVRAGGDGLDVMLITSRETHRWIVPKGWPMKGRRDHRAAAIEAREEAGVVGRIHKRPIGAYTYRKQVDGRNEPCRVMVYRLDVEDVKRAWPEVGQRERRWFSARDAAGLVSEPGLATMILSLDDQGTDGPAV